MEPFSGLLLILLRGDFTSVTAGVSICFPTLTQILNHSCSHLGTTVMPLDFYLCEGQELEIKIEVVMSCSGLGNDSGGHTIKRSDSKTKMNKWDDT